MAMACCVMTGHVMSWRSPLFSPAAASHQLHPTEEPEPAPGRQAAPPAAPQDEGPSTSGAGSASSGKGGISLQGDELKAFLARAQAGGGLQAALGGGGGGAGRPGVPPPQFEEVEEEEGTAQPRHATVDDPEFSKYWKAPVAGGAGRHAQPREPCIRATLPKAAAELV